MGGGGGKGVHADAQMQMVDFNLYAIAYGLTMLNLCHRPQQRLLLLLLKTVLKEKKDRRREGGRRGVLASETSALLNMRIVSNCTPLQTRSFACVPPSALTGMTYI